MTVIFYTPFNGGSRLERRFMKIIKKLAKVTVKFWWTILAAYCMLVALRIALQFAGMLIGSTIGTMFLAVILFGLWYVYTKILNNK